MHDIHVPAFTIRKELVVGSIFFVAGALLFVAFSTIATTIGTNVSVTGSLFATSTVQATGNIVGYGSLGLGTTTPSRTLSLNGKAFFDSSEIRYASSSATALTFSYQKSATSTIPALKNAWSIGTTTAGGNEPIFSINGSNGNVGIGTASPEDKLHVFNDGDDSALRLTSYAGEPQVRGYRAQGSENSPSAVTSGIRLFSIGGFGYTGSAFAQSARINALTEEAWTTTARGSYWAFDTTSPGTTSMNEKMRITGAGKVGIGTTTPSGKLSVEMDTTNIMAFVVSDVGSSSPAFIVKGNNNVGIGTSSPASRFSLSSSGTTTIHVGTTATTKGSCFQMYDAAHIAYRAFISKAGAWTVEAGTCE